MTTRIITDPADVLDAAADAIEVDGWTQGTYRNGLKNLCILGAIRYVIFGKVYSYDRTLYRPSLDKAKLQDATHATLYNALGTPVAFWNDQTCHNGLEAIELLRRTAKKYREDHS